MPLVFLKTCMDHPCTVQACVASGRQLQEQVVVVVVRQTVSYKAGQRFLMHFRD